MTCKDCLLCPMCFAVREVGEKDRYAENCPNFKNKSDFEEVVRCKDCKYFACYNPNDKYCMFGNALSVSNDNSYCSYGEREQ